MFLYLSWWSENWGVLYSALRFIKEKLENNPNWTGEDLEKMYTYDSNLELYRLHIKPTLLFESSSAQIAATSNSGTATLLDTHAENPTAIEPAPPASIFPKTMSSSREVKKGLYRHGIYFQYKPKPIVDAQPGLRSLSMNPSEDTNG